MKSTLVQSAVLLAAVAAQASTLSLSIENHMAVVKADGKQKVPRTAFTDEAVVANVKPDVFAVARVSESPGRLRYEADMRKCTELRPGSIPPARLAREVARTGETSNLPKAAKHTCEW
jgi:hypothetical protein